MKKQVNKTMCSVKNCNCNNTKPKKYWLYKDHIYKRRPSSRFEDMFKNAVPVLITPIIN